VADSGGTGSDGPFDVLGQQGGLGGDAGMPVPVVLPVTDQGQHTLPGRLHAEPGDRFPYTVTGTLAYSPPGNRFAA
jgi:hypothetical protein